MRSFWNGALAWPFAVLMMLCAPVAQGAPVTWYLQGVTFSDGGSASGSFAYDAASDTFSAVQLVTTAGTVRAGSAYGAATGVGTASVVDVIDPALPVIDLLSERFLLYLRAPMTNAGGLILIEDAQELTCLTFACTFVTANDPGLGLRSLAADASASITSRRPGQPVPEPATAALVGLGLLAALTARRRRADGPAHCL